MLEVFNRTGIRGKQKNGEGVTGGWLQVNGTRDSQGMATHAENRRIKNQEKENGWINDGIGAWIKNQKMEIGCN